MGNFIKATVRLIQAFNRVYAKKWSFSALFLCVFVFSTLVLGRLDLLPDTSAVKASSVAVTASTTPLVLVSAVAPAPVTVIESPAKIEIPAINLVATIANPTSTDIEVLDQYLLKGAVRYPTSASLGETGNVVLFGHSSYLPVVRNQAYKTFNGIQKLAKGNAITVSSSGTAYTYAVRSIAKESANDAGIPLDVTGRVLTLATCDSFGAKTDRFVVVADFVESHPAS